MISLKDKFVRLCRRLKRQQALVARWKEALTTTRDPIAVYTALDQAENAELATRVEIDAVLDEHNAAKNAQSN